MRMKNLFTNLALFMGGVGLLLGCSSASSDAERKDVPELGVKVPMQGNSWVVNNLWANETVVTDNGIEQWRQSSDVIGVFFKSTVAGKMHLGLNAKCSNGSSKIKVSYGSQSHVVDIKNNILGEIYVGDFDVAAPGYHRIELQGISKTGDTFAEITQLLVGGEVCRQSMYFVNEDVYWGRRGPSVHMSYQVPESAGDVKWFYNEVSVPAGQDVIGSYFMANGFGEGYFGMQVNSETERRILFSVWSPYHTDDPSSIPDDQKITLLKKGEGVRTGEFGNEGSGGQSFRVFDWKPEAIYRFLLKVEPSVNGCTDYTAYFKPSENGNWELVASFRRPHTVTYVERPYSFLENFITHTGCVTRKGYYGNQWVCNTAGQWFELVKARFTADATARKESRMDYAGGVENGLFYLKNCGFFSDTTPLDVFFERPATGKQPQIDFEQLP